MRCDVLRAEAVVETLEHRCDGSGGDPNSIKARTMAKYDDQWKGQDETAATGRRKSLSLVADSMLSLVGPLSGKVVVDLGIGTGSLAFRALERSSPKALIGIDFSSQGLRVARDISRQGRFTEQEVELLRADLERIPLRNGTVDVVLSQATVNLLPDKCTAMREIARIVRQGATVAISDSFRTAHGTPGGSWEQCIAGALTVSEFSSLALSSGLIITGQMDLTQQVRALVSEKKWDWPEFLQHNMDYRVFMLRKG